jgi:hypothetical protein
MHKNQDITNLEQLLKRIGEAVKDKERVSLGSILKVVGHRSFGPLLLVAGLVMFAPIIGDIPGVPVMMGVLVVLTAGQLLFRREHLWLPRWLLKRSVAQDRLDKVLKRLQSPVRFVDRLLRQRLTIFTDGAGVYVIAIVCTIISAATPLMEVVPLTANGAGAILTIFGLALIAHDGLLALFAFLLTISLFGLVMYNLL